MSKKMQKVYYCRAMDGLNTKDISDEYKKVKILLESNNCILINAYQETMSKLDFTKENAEMIVSENLKMLTQADVVMINFSIVNHTYIGCVGEMIYAKINGLQVISIVGDGDAGKHFWTLYHSDHIVKTLDEAIELLKRRKI